MFRNVARIHYKLLYLYQLFLLEEQRDKKIDNYARVIQKSFQKYFNRQKFLRQKEEAAGKIYDLIALLKNMT